MPAFNPLPFDPRIAALLTDFPSVLFSDRLYRSIELMDCYSLELAIKLLHELAVVPPLAAWRSVPELCHELAFSARFVIALRWLLERLVEPGLLATEATDGIRRYRLLGGLRQPDLAELRAIGLGIDPINAATLDLLDAAAAVYPNVARGENGEEALFGMGRIGLWLNYFRNDNPPYAINNWIGAFSATKRLSDRPRLRILEVGAGSGSGTEALLKVLSEQGLAGRLELYRVTEPNPFFRRRAERELKARYRDLPLEFGTLDINKPWAEQGAATGQFDLVLGINVLHVARDLLFSLSQARAVLAPGGWLIIGECLRPVAGQPVYTELMFQILDSYLDVVTDLEFRPNPGFLTPEQWQLALTRAGFAQPEIAPDQARIRELYPHFFTGAVCGRVAP